MKKSHLSRHHRKPRHLGGSNCRCNIRLCTQREHDLWNFISNYEQRTLGEMAKFLSGWIDPDYEFIVRRKL